MEELYIVTGAAGHLGSNIIRLLRRRNKRVRGLVLPAEAKMVADTGRIRYVTGDVTEIGSLEALFRNCVEYRTIVIHTAGIVNIADEVSRLMYDVNVKGTANIAKLCLAYKAARLVYVSSVHAIPEKGRLQVMNETERFSPEWVTGGYAKTKAEATALVLAMVKERGLPAVVVQPSGILGPYDRKGNHLVQLVKDYARGKIPACVKGGYDFVDVRDVAYGCVAAAEKGRTGECYILSNRHYEIRDVLRMVRQLQGGRRIPTLPSSIAKCALPFLEWQARRRVQRPLYTRYSLYTLRSNDKFSHNKATAELNFCPRDLYFTIRDTVRQL